MNFLTSNKTVVIVVAAVIIIFAVAEALDLRNQTYVGLSTDGNNTVTRVRPGSPAEKAGFQLGDRILTSGGIAVTDTKALSRRVRPAVGETREYVVERSGQQQSLSLTFAGLPNRQMMLNVVRLLTGLCFLVFGLWPYFKERNLSTELLAAVGLCFALFAIGPPYFSSYAIRTVIGVLFLPVIIFGFAALLHFVLAFPQPKGWLERKNSLLILYAPALFITAYVIFLILARPDATSTLNQVNRILFGLFFIGYFGLSIVVIVRTYLKATAKERSAYGLNIMAVGVILALLWPVVSIIVGIAAPKVIIPGSDFFGLTFILLPLSFAYGVMKSLKAAGEPAEPQTD